MRGPQGRAAQREAMSDVSPNSAPPSGDCDKLLDYLYDELRGEEAEAFKRHLEGCERCRRDLESMQRTRSAARESVPLVEPPPSVMGALNAQLLHAAAQRARSAPRGKVIPFVRKMVMAPAFMAAAGFVVVGGVVGTMWLRGHVLMPPPVEDQPAAAPAPASATATPEVTSAAAQAEEKNAWPAKAPADETKVQLPPAPPAEAEADKAAESRFATVRKHEKTAAAAPKPAPQGDALGGLADDGERAKKREVAADLPSKADTKIRLEVGNKVLDAKEAPARAPLGYTNTTPAPKAGKDRGAVVDGLLGESSAGGSATGSDSYYRDARGTRGSSSVGTGRSRGETVLAPSTKPHAAQGPGQWNADVNALPRQQAEGKAAAPVAQTATPQQPNAPVAAPAATAPAPEPAQVVARPANEREPVRSADSMRKQAEELAATGRCDEAKRLYDELEKSWPAYKVPVKDRVTLLHCFSQAGEQQRAVDELDSLRREGASRRVIQSEEQSLKQQVQSKPASPPPPQAAQHAAPSKKAKAKSATEAPADKAAY